eukprot:10871989-Alexandrium_andersonii.AAC.1
MKALKPEPNYNKLVSISWQCLEIHARASAKDQSNIMVRKQACSHAIMSDWYRFVQASAVVRFK